VIVAQREIAEFHLRLPAPKMLYPGGAGKIGLGINAGAE
jgi:hypothetical protein